MEIEAKYRATRAIKPSQIEALDFSPYTLGERVDHELHDTLLDTPARELANRRYSLRVRQDGDEMVLTLKAPAEAEGGIHRREEWEEPLNGGVADDPATWPEAFQHRVRDLVGNKPLQEILRVRNHRRTWDVLHDGQRVGELALDKGTIEADDAQLSLHEIEFELKDEGQQEALDHIVGILTAHLPLEPEHQSKMQRGLALLEPQGHTRDLRAAAQAVLMEPKAPLAEAGRSILAGHLQKLVQNLPIAQEGSDPEGVHDARVATRRLRAVLKVLGERVYEEKPIRRLRRDLRELAADLGIVRDTDVFLLALDDYAKTLADEEHEGLAPLYNLLRRQRDPGRKALLKELASKEHRKLIARMEAFVTTPGKDVREVEGEEGEVFPMMVRDHAGSILWQQYEAVRAYRRVMPDAPIESLHRLRIAIKRLRYTFDLFMDALDPEAKTLHKRLVAAQEHLGDLNDAEVALGYVAQVLERHPTNPALLNYRANRLARHDALYASAEEALKPIFGSTFRQSLATVIAKL